MKALKKHEYDLDVKEAKKMSSLVHRCGRVATSDFMEDIYSIEESLSYGSRGERKMSCLLGLQAYV
jgi:hypothetical protein